MAQKPSVLIIGAGIMGVSSALCLAEAGHRVILVEQGDIPNPFASSTDQHRLIRFFYGAEAGYTAMVTQAYAAWGRLWQRLGRQHYVPTGTLGMSDRQHSWLYDTGRCLEAMGLAPEWLSPGELTRRFPLLRPDGLDDALYHPTGGVLLADRIVEDTARLAAEAGVEIRYPCRITDIDPEAGVAITADGNRLTADRLIIAAGPWTTDLVPSMATRARPSRQIPVFLTPPAETRAAWERMPMMLDIDPARGFYMVPPVAGTDLKYGDHSFFLTGHPDQDRQPAPDECAPLAALAGNRLAAYERYRLVETRTCFYTWSGADERFVVEPLGSRGWILTGFTGHGFKFGPLMGERMVEALGERVDPATLAQWAAGLPKEAHP